MKTPTNRKANKPRKRFVFRSKSRQVEKTLFRILSESMLMLVSGTWILAFVTTLPRRYDLNRLLMEARHVFIDGLSQMFDGILLFGSIFLLTSLVVLGLVLFVGAICRLLRAFSLYLSKLHKHRMK